MPNENESKKPIVIGVTFQPVGRLWMGEVSEYRVVGKMSDGEEISLFRYFPDELTFSSDELIGKTADEAIAVHTEKDMAYLRS